MAIFLQHGVDRVSLFLETCTDSFGILFVTIMLEKIAIDRGFGGPKWVMLM